MSLTAGEQSAGRRIVGRFAPSPTGPLHLGSLVTAVGSYILARAAGGEWLVRMEDLDTPRVVPGAADDILRTLEAMGLHWDREVVFQSRRLSAYEEAFQELLEAGMVYPCDCSRAEVAGASSAPHAGEDGAVYPGTCRQGPAHGRPIRAFRVRIPSEEIFFEDGIQGPLSQDLGRSVGDFVIKRADGPFAYQFAVVVDDGAAGVTQVVRGADLVDSTPRQIHLQHLLGLPTPSYYHVPLICGADGGKLSKRDCAVSLGSGRVLADAAGPLLVGCLRALGQDPPDHLVGTSPGEALHWASENFSVRKVPKGSRPFPSLQRA